MLTQSDLRNSPLNELIEQAVISFQNIQYTDVQNTRAYTNCIQAFEGVKEICAIFNNNTLPSYLQLYNFIQLRFPIADIVPTEAAQQILFNVTKLIFKFYATHKNFHAIFSFDPKLLEQLSNDLIVSQFTGDIQWIEADNVIAYRYRIIKNNREKSIDLQLKYAELVENLLAEFFKLLSEDNRTRLINAFLEDLNDKTEKLSDALDLIAEDILLNEGQDFSNLIKIYDAIEQAEIESEALAHEVHHIRELINNDDSRTAENWKNTFLKHNLVKRSIKPLLNKNIDHINLKIKKLLNPNDADKSLAHLDDVKSTLQTLKALPSRHDLKCFLVTYESDLQNIIVQIENEFLKNFNLCLQQIERLEYWISNPLLENFSKEISEVELKYADEHNFLQQAKRLLETHKAIPFQEINNTYCNLIKTNNNFIYYLDTLTPENQVALLKSWDKQNHWMLKLFENSSEQDLKLILENALACACLKLNEKIKNEAQDCFIKNCEAEKLILIEKCIHTKVIEIKHRFTTKMNALKNLFQLDKDFSTEAPEIQHCLTLTLEEKLSENIENEIKHRIQALYYEIAIKAQRFKSLTPFINMIMEMYKKGEAIENSADHNKKTQGNSFKHLAIELFNQSKEYILNSDQTDSQFLKQTQEILEHSEHVKNIKHLEIWKPLIAAIGNALLCLSVLGAVVQAIHWQKTGALFFAPKTNRQLKIDAAKEIITNYHEFNLGAAHS